MSSLTIALLYCLAAAAAATAGASWFWRFRFRRKVFTGSSVEAQRAAEVLVRLQELAARIAFDVDEHSSQVGEINDRLHSFDDREPAAIIEVIASLIEANEQMRMKLASTEDKLRQQAQVIQTHATEARTDALTLLSNRRAFDDELARRTAESVRHGRTYSLIMADVDHFKKFNDTYGHQAGDEILRAIAKLLRRKMREMDIVARYGGEEFAVILPGTNLDEACKAALRACEAIEKSRLYHEGQEFHVTASFGVTEAPGNGDSTAIVGQADRALYAAKEGGRNCVFLCDDKDVRRVLANRPPPVLPAVLPRSAPTTVEQAETGKPEAVPDATAGKPKPDLSGDIDASAIPELPSRTAFCQQIRNRTAEWKRGGPLFSVLLLEVNHYGENGGKPAQRMREIATRLTIQFLIATIREMDVMGHYAPGCFGLLLPTAGLPDAIRIAERLRESFLRFKRPADGDEAKLTLSVGAVQVMETDDSVSVLKRAEAALDAADRRGGNRAYYHDGERCAPITAMLETMDYLT